MEKPRTVAKLLGWGPIVLVSAAVSAAEMVGWLGQAQVVVGLFLEKKVEWVRVEVKCMEKELWGGDVVHVVEVAVIFKIGP